MSVDGRVTEVATKCEVIIIGGGLSGMSAAKWLHDAGVEVLVLEADNRVGGRTYTKEIPGVGHVDLGGAYLGPGQKHVLRLARDLGVTKYPIDEGTGSTVFYDDDSGRRQLFPADGAPRIWNPIVNLDINNFFRSLDVLGKEVPLDAPWTARRAQEWDQMTVKEYADKVIWTQTMRDFLTTFHDLRINMNTHESSFLWFLWHIRQYGSVKRLLSAFGTEKWKFVGGSMQLSEKMADRLGDGRVLLRKPVVGVRQDDGSVTVTTLDGCSYRARYVIFAASPAVEPKLHFEPAMPQARIQLMQRSPMGCMIKVVVLYDVAFWHERGLSGSAVIDGGQQDDLHPINFTIDGTRPDGSHASIIGFVNTDKARRLMATTDRDEREHRIARSLAKVFDDDRFLRPLAYEEFDWAAQQYSGGCGMTIFSPGCFTTYGSVLRDPVGRVFFAGTETARNWSGHMDGAVSAGERAAREVLHATGRINRDQIWLEEPDSEEDAAHEDMPFTRLELILPSVGGLVTFLKVVASLAVLSATFYSVQWLL